MTGLIPEPVKQRLRSRTAPVRPASPGPPRERVLSWARDRARELEPMLAASRPDVLFGCCATALFYDLKGHPPIVHFSDATARLLGDGYSMFREMEPERREAYDELERGTLSRVAAGLYPSAWALASAVGDYGLDPARGHVVPMGATVMPEAGERIEADPPSRGNLRLCIVAGDPARKRVGLAVEAARLLRERGWNVTLTHVGTPLAGAEGLDYVRSVGRLRLSSARDRARHRTVLRESHVMVLPSVAEAFGIAPCEAAHFGRPSVVSDAGGLPSVVEDGRTGVVVPVDAGAEAYARAVEEVAGDEARYRAMSEAALERARRVLNWEAWGDRAAEIVRTAVG